MYSSTRKNTFILVTLPSFSISGVISAEKMYDTPSHTNVCNFFQFSTYIFSADIIPEILKLGRVTKVKMFFLVLLYVSNIDLFEFSAAILEKSLFCLKALSKAMDFD